MKHLENFKSEYIQSIYDFLEQDADVTNFKRDLIAVAEYKKTNLHDLEAQYFEYHDLMKQELKGKIVFIFREDGYLGMFGDGFGIEIERTREAYMRLETGDKVSAILKSKNNPELNFVDGFIYKEFRRMYCIIYIIQNVIHGYNTLRSDDWMKYGRYNWELYYDGVVRADHTNLTIDRRDTPNLIISKKQIYDLKNEMHFSLVI